MNESERLKLNAVRLRNLAAEPYRLNVVEKALILDAALDLETAAVLAQPARVQPAAVRQEPTWQPIETAPKDGWHFLAWCQANRCTYISANCGKEWRVDGEYRPAAEAMAMFSHWMPLPPAPTDPQEGGEK
jgi:hypothetical protein